MDIKTKSGIITASIYKPKYGDCSNGGISSTSDDVIVIWGDTPVPEKSGCPVVRIIHRNIFGEDYYHAEPIEKRIPGGFMAGGCFVYTSDSRFPFSHPISLHDRQED